MTKFNPIFQKRIGFKGDLGTLLDKALELYDVGSLVEYSVIETGYEHLNIKVESSEGLFCAKFFAKVGAFKKNQKECTEYVRNVKKAIEAGVRHPKLIANKKGDYLSTVVHGSKKFYFCIQEFIKSETRNPLNQSFSTKDLKQIGIATAKLHSSKYLPPNYYDEWSVINFGEEYKKKRRYLEDPDKSVVKRIYEKIKKIDLKKLPHAFTHGDIITSNVLKSTTGEINIIDFSVSNYGPRLIDLAILACDVAYTEGDPVKSVDEFDVILTSYQKILRLTQKELKVLPVIIDACFAMFILLASYEINSKKELNDEDYYWRDLGRKGLGSYYRVM